MPPKNQREYRQRVHATLSSVIEHLQSKKPTERKLGLEEIEQVFSNDAAVEFLEAEDGSSSKDGSIWLTVFQAMFSAVLEERRAYLRGKQTTLTENKLSTAANRLRWLVGRALHKIKKKVLKALITHITQCLVEKGEFVKPLAQEYVATLRQILSHPMHMGQLPPETWTEILVLSCAGILGDPIPRALEWTEADSPDTPSPDSDNDSDARAGQKRPRMVSQNASNQRNASTTNQKSLSAEQIDLAAVLHILLRAPTAPIIPLPKADSEVSQDSGPDPLFIARILLSKLRRFFKDNTMVTSAHHDAVLALARLLTEIEFNGRELLIPFAPEMLSVFLDLLATTATRSEKTKSGLLIVIRTLFPFFLLGHKDSSPSTLASELKSMSRRLEDGKSADKANRSLPLEVLRLGLFQSPSSNLGAEAFVTCTFRHGPGFNDHHAVLWSTLELHADCIAESLKNPVIHNNRGSVSPTKPKKRRLEPPASSSQAEADQLLVGLTRKSRSTKENKGTLDARGYSLQVVLFTIARHWDSLSPNDQSSVVTELTNLLNDEENSIQSLSFICLATVAANSTPTVQSKVSSTVSEQLIDWASIWSNAARRTINPGVSRAACLMMHVLLARAIIEPTQAIKEVERIVEELILQGPPKPQDSVCAFLADALRLTNKDIRLHRKGFGEKVLDWLGDTWSTLQGGHATMDSFGAKEALGLFEAICGLAVTSEIVYPVALPDCSTVDWLVERQRTDIIREFFFHHRLPPFQLQASSHTNEASIQSQDMRSSIEARTGEQGMPPPIAVKCSRFVFKYLEHLAITWESMPDTRMVKLPQVRLSLEQAVLALLFEATLNLNGYRVNIKVLKTAYRLIVHILGAAVDRQWRTREKTLILTALDPLTGVAEASSRFPAFEAMADPGVASGLSRKQLMAFRNHPNSKSMSSTSVAAAVQRTLWQELHKCVELTEMIDAAHNLLVTFVSDAPLEKDDGFASGPDVPVEGAVVEADNDGALLTWSSSCLRLLTAPSRHLPSSSEIFRGGEHAFNFLFQEDEEVRLVRLGPALCEAIVQKNLVLTHQQLSAALDAFSLLSTPAFYHSEAAQLFLISFLTATMPTWTQMSDRQDEQEEILGRVRPLCDWLTGVASAHRLASWRVRDCLTLFLDCYITVDPQQTFLSASESDDEEAMDIDARPSMTGVTVLVGMTKDVDARVRFRAAVANARALDAVVGAKLADGPKLWKGIFLNYSSRLERYEHMLTRILSMGNIVVINAELSRIPYWHILETALHTSDYLTQSEAVLDACAIRIGMEDRQALFRAFASSVASALARYNMEFMQLPPAMLGFRNRSQQVLESFPLIFPSYCHRLGDDPTAVLKQQFAKEYIQKAGLTQEQALSSILPEVLGLRMAYFIDDHTDTEDPNSILSSDLDVELETVILDLTVQSSSADPMETIRESWDGIAVSILRRIEDTNYSKNGSIVRALHTVEDANAAQVFATLTRYRREGEFVMHQPLTPSVRAITIIRALKRLQSMVLLSKAPSPTRLSQTGSVYHIIYQLLSAIDSNPLLNERYRLINALCLHIARNHQKFIDFTLLRVLMFGAISLLKQHDLATAAQSIIDWCLNQYKSVGADHLVGLSTMLSRIGQIAQDYVRVEDDEKSRELGFHLLSWIERRMVAFGTEMRLSKVIPALMVWPRELDTKLQALLPDENMYENLAQTMNDAEMSTGKFRIARKLFEMALAQAGGGGVVLDDFWILKESIPDAQDLRDEDVEAFADLLSCTTGHVQAPHDEITSTPSLAMRFDIIPSQPRPSDPDLGAKQYLVLALHSMLAANSTRQVDSAYQTLRAVLATGFEPKAVKSEAMKHVFNEVTLLKKYRIPFLTLPVRTLDELVHIPVAKSSNFDAWVVELTSLFAAVLATRDPFFGQLSHILKCDIAFAGEAFPILTRQLLHGTPSSPAKPRRDALSEYFTQVLHSPDTALSTRRAIVHLILHLRHYPPPDQQDPLAYTRWLDIDYMLLARAASSCGLYTTALLFLELAAADTLESNRQQHDAAAEDILYTIYRHIDEPDGFYGVRGSAVRKFLLRRFAHESQWDKAFQYHGATYETGRNVSGSSKDVVQSLHSLGFDKVAMQVFTSADSQESTADTSELAYNLGWRTETWDLPSDTTEGCPTAMLYAALQCIHRERDPQVVEGKLRGLLRQETSRLQHVGNEDIAGIKESIRLVVCLRDLQRHSMYDIDEVGTEVVNAKLPPYTEFQDFENLMSTRISCIRARRLQEEDGMLGDIRNERTSKLARAEVHCLMKLNQISRENNHTQIALNSLQRAHALVEDPVSMFHLETEFAAVLWTQGEQNIAVEHLRSVMTDIPEDGTIRLQLPSLRSQLGEWISQAALEKPVDIQALYFTRAVEDVKQATGVSPTEQANVYRRFATFCEQQYLAHIRSPDAAFLRSNCDDLQREVDQLESEMKGMPGQSREWKQYERQLRKTRDELEQYSSKYEDHVTASAGFLQLAIRHFARSLLLATATNEDDIVIRLCALWFSNFRNDQLNKAVRSALRAIPTYKLIFISHQLSSRLSSHDPHEGHLTLQAIVEKLSTEHIFHTFYQLFALTNGKGSPEVSSRRASRSTAEGPLSDDHRVEAALQVLQKLRSGETTEQRAKDLGRVCNAYLEWAKYRLPKVKSGTAAKIPETMQIAKLQDVRVPIATDTLEIDPTGRYLDFVHLQSYNLNYTTAGGINLPKITKCTGSDGIERKQLFKGQGDDDMRQDAVMEQVFGLVNYLLLRDRQTRKRCLCVRTYKVIPLAPQAGLLEFVPHTTPLKEFLDRAHAAYRPRDMTDAEASKRLIQARDSRVDLLAVYNKICSRLKPVMRHWFTETSRLPHPWYHMRLNYARSVATTSIVGHVIGLGDRHTSNILLEMRTGEVVHIDLGIAFDQGRQLAIPELVPFRLTRDMVDGFGSSGVEGVFRRCAEETLRVLRADSNVIMTVLGVFKTDPLYSWTVHPLKLKQKQQEALNGTLRINSTADTHTTVDTVAGGDALESDTVEKMAERALASVARKLDKSMSVSHDVQELIAQATDPANLAHIYFGWRPWL